MRKALEYFFYPLKVISQGWKDGFTILLLIIGAFFGAIMVLAGAPVEAITIAILCWALAVAIASAIDTTEVFGIDYFDTGGSGGNLPFFSFLATIICPGFILGVGIAYLYLGVAAIMLL